MRDVNLICVRSEYLVDMICGAENGALGANILGIANAILDDVASGLVDTADH